MAGPLFFKPGINDAVRRNLDGTYLPQQKLTSPYTATYSPSSPYVRMGANDFWDKWRAQRTQYLVTDADVSSPFVSGQWSILWDDVMPDVNYTVLVTVEDANYSPPVTMFVPAQIQKTVGGVTGRLSCLFGQANHQLTIHAIALHD